MKFQSYSQILSVVVYVTNFNMCNFIIITFSALKLQVALYFRNRLAPSVNIESRTVTLWHLVLKKNIILYVFFKACRGISYMHLMKIILELKKKTKSNAYENLWFTKNIARSAFFFLMYYPASWMSPVLYVHSWYSAYFKSYGYSKPSKDMFFPLGYAMIL